MKPPRSRLLSVYRATTRAAEPVRPFVLSRRLKAGKEHGLRLAERAGHASLARPEGGLFWLHGASVGEFISILPLVTAISAKGIAVLVTTGTLTSARLAAERLPAAAMHQFVPLDFPNAVARFYDYWRPDIAIFAESEIWPNLMKEALDRGIPLAIVNGRMSDRSFRRWQRLSSLVKPLLERLDICLAQSENDAKRFRALGATRALEAGNLKFDAEPLPFLPDALAALEAAIADRPVWLAASTHAGEEEIIFKAHRKLASLPGHPLTIVIPRHPERGDEVAALAARYGFSVRQRSLGDQPEPNCDVYVADTLGELGSFYRLCPAALIGGSLALPGGGHNPIEAAMLGCVIVHGAHTRNFADLYARLAEAGASLAVHDEDSLAAIMKRLLTDKAYARLVSERAKNEIDVRKGGLSRTLEHLAPYQASILARTGNGPI